MGGAAEAVTVRRIVARRRVQRHDGARQRQPGEKLEKGEGHGVASETGGGAGGPNPSTATSITDTATVA
jgi:hypothetical protein